jgi:small-conductance mechanosensitive channel
MNQVYWGNTVLAYVLAAGGILLCWAVIRILRRLVLKRIRNWTSRTKTEYDDILFGAIERFVLPYLYLFINYHIITSLNLDERLLKVLTVAMAVVTVYYIVRLLNFVIHVSVTGIMRRRNESEQRMKQLTGILNVVKAVMWLMGILVLFDNLGYNVTTIVAGLGVGGIAIALAAQTVLADLFSYFTIFFDRPFEIGDAIAVGNETGTIEHIGIKTTRLRSLSGEQLVMSNADLTKNTIHNFKRQQERRVAFRLAIAYQTREEMLLKIPEIVKAIIQEQQNVRFDRAHLLNFGEYSINYEIVYIKLSADYNQYMDTHQQVLYKIFATFQQMGISFAVPSHRIFVESDEKKAVQIEEKNH